MNIYKRSQLFCERIRQFAVKNNVAVVIAQQKIPDSDKITEIIANIKELQSYYAGGTLCVDKVVPDDVLMMNLNGEYFLFSGEKGLLTDTQIQSLFDLYKEIKGETNYYKTQLKKFKK